MTSKATLKPAWLPGLARRLGEAALLVLATTTPAAEMQLLRGHVPAATAHLQAIGRLPGTNRLNLAIGLPLRNREALTNLLEQIYNPASPNYHHYLTAEQFAERFGPTEKDYEAVMAFARAQGLTVTGTHPNRTLVDVKGSVAVIERALHVHLQIYQHPTEARTFYAPDVEPTLDLAVPALGINGLDNFVLPHPISLRTGTSGNAAGTTSHAAPDGIAYTTGSGPRGNFIGKDFRAAYTPGVTLNGSGQAVGLFELDGYYPSDITAYERLAGLPNVTLTNVLLDEFPGIPGGHNDEVALDIDMAVCMAPGISRVIVYEGFAPQANDILNRMATDNQARQLSSSWGFGSQVDAMREQIYQQFAMQGQTMFQASGDDGAWSGAITPPSDDPLLTIVGGTSLTTGAGGAWSSETTWSGSGGGVSTSYTIPIWQQGLNMSANQGSTTMRNIPDVACLADGVIWLIANNGQEFAVGGTSAAAPLWAGFAALANQQATAAGKPPIGFINPTLSAIGQGSGYAAAFHDITTGNNTTASSPGKFFAVPGYDLCTGWGTPAGSNLISALVFPPDALLVTPAAGVTSAGAAGGPFSISAQNYSLTTFGPVPVNWALANTNSWLNILPVSGTVASNVAPAAVTFSLNSAASNLPAGSYTATVWFTNLNDGFAQSRQFTLDVITPPQITVQPSNQTVLPGALATFTVGTASNALLFYQWQENGTNLTDGGNISGSTTSTLALGNVSSADAGTYKVVVSNSLGTNTSTGTMLTVLSVTAPGVTMSTLYSFTGGSDGGNPNGLAQTADGNFFGTTQNGGLNSSGTVFKMAPGGVPIVLYPFMGGNDGGHPQNVLVQGADGSFYGTTFDGGFSDNGTVFNVNSNGSLTTLVGFNITNGDLPFAGLTSGADGNYYGTTYQGGASGRGSVYKMTPGGQLTTLYSFTDTADGGFVYGGLARGADGSFYGTTYAGGSANGGTLFKVTTNGLLTTLISFNGTDGSFPYAGVVQDENGNFYGVTSGGGGQGAGTIFKWSSGGIFTTLYSFTGGTDGAQPVGGLMQGGDGNFYGTTAYGGSYGDGTVFRMAPDGTFTNLLQFDGYNGANPSAPLTQGADGGLYGTTQNGGPGGAGTIFRLGISGAVQINTQPADQTVFSGANAVFSVVTLGVQPMTYRWAINGTNLSDGGNISGSGTRVLTISNVTPANAEIYSVTVHNASGTAFSDDAILEVVVAPPIITMQPTNVTLAPGATAAFSIGVIGSQPLTYQWQINPTNLNLGVGFSGFGPVNLTDGGNISGSTTSTLTIANAIEENNGFYSVVVSNPVTSVTSAFAILNVVPPSAPGTQLSTLHAFMGGGDGYKPSGLALGTDGNLYGTTQFGGAQHAGSVFMVTTGGLVTNIVSFDGIAGFGPMSGVVQGPDGNFYGTTEFGGTNDAGNVFMMTPAQTRYFTGSNGFIQSYLASTLTSLYSFTGGSDGNTPIAPLMRGADGNLYGTTEYGGDFGAGNVFGISTNGVITNVYSFTGGVDGGYLTNGLMQASDGNFYGVTQSGGTNGLGSVFRLTPSGAFNTVYSFTGGTDGNYPNGPLVQGLDGSLYGTTRHNTFHGFAFYGVLFKVTTNGAFTTLYVLNANDGHYPAAGMIQGSDGIFYGTAENGGTDNNNGTVFYITTGGTVATLVNFDGFDDGANPETPVVEGADGNLYGTTRTGGEFGKGTVYRLDVSMRPLLVKPAQTNGNFSFIWSAVPGRMYQVEYSTNLSFSNWTNSGAAFPALGATVNVTNATGADGQRFYRVMVVP
jgi:uncharacterized repeat protein (TIGR03803 family)